MKKLVVILDPAHGEYVSGKASPDFTHREYLWSRSICKSLEYKLTSRGFKVYTTNPSIGEIGLSKRKQNANNIEILPGETKFLVSLHNNAAGDGKLWKKARGFEIYTSPGQTVSDKFADIIFEHIKESFKDVQGFNLRADYSDGDPDKEANFTVLMGAYFAVLIEWLFMDNIEDLKLLKDESMNERFIDTLVSALEEINSKL